VVGGTREKRADTSATRSEPLVMTMKFTMVRIRNTTRPITTLFRLALAISTTRLILIQADAGHIVETFGRFVAACRASSRGRSGPTPRRPAPNPW
jgi:hypothetical protein